LFETTEFQTGLALGFLRVHARANLFVRQQQFVRTDFLIHFTLLRC
jgi:hypothetical protein